MYAKFYKCAMADVRILQQYSIEYKGWGLRAFEFDVKTSSFKTQAVAPRCRCIRILKNNFLFLVGHSSQFPAQTKVYPLQMSHSL